MTMKKPPTRLGRRWMTPAGITLAAILALTVQPLQALAQGASPAVIDKADTAWMMVSSALVLLMVPGLALFYGGMVRHQNVLSTLMHSFVAMGIIMIQWMVLGYSLAFGQDIGGFVGGFNFFMLNNVGLEPKGTIPHLVFMVFQGMFAIITPALISGAVAERMKFSTYVVFITLWSTLVYDPIAHWVWGEGGWLLKMGALDFAGGTVVHLNSGVAALVAALMIGPRLAYRKERIYPNNLVLTLLGAGLLWFGWFGFNAGSALASGELAALAFVTTMIATSAAMMSWLAVEWLFHGKPSMLGAASGAVAGLVVITPAAGFVSPTGALMMGLIGGSVCYGGVLLKNKGRYDDSLDVFGVHGIGGLTGALLTGVFATTLFNKAGVPGLLDGNTAIMGVQAMGALAAAAYSMVMTAVILLALKFTMGLRVEEEEERMGLDTSQHGERAYNIP